MFKNIKKLITLGILVSTFIFAVPVYAADIVVMNPDGQPYGAHEIWAHSEMGQSFIAEALGAKGGFFVSYSPESAALMPPNATTTEVIVSLYAGESLDPATRLHQTTFMVDATQNGFLDVDYAGLGITFEPGKTYTIGISSPYNRGWIIPSVCDFQNLVGGQPTGAYANGHPFLQGQMVTNEVGICDNAFRMIDTLVSVTPTPVEPTPVPLPTPTPSYSVTARKAELKGVITEVSANFVVVKSKTVYFGTNTQIKWNYNTAFAIGQNAQVKGFKNSDGSVTATVIEVQ